MSDQFQQLELIEGQYYVSRTDNNESAPQLFATLSERILGGPFANKDDANQFVSQQDQQPTSYHVWQHSAEFVSQA